VTLRLQTRIGFYVALAALALIGESTHADPADEALRLYAVNVVQDPPQEWTGYGIYLGKGLILTAAHVVGSAAQTKPSVRIAGLELPAKAIKEGSLDRVDLTLLSIDEEKLPISLRMRRMPLCQRPPWPGEPVIVAVPEGIAQSRIMSPQLLAPNVRSRFPTVIKDVATTGNSGSGVFDSGSKCLLGIMSRKIFIRPNGVDGETRDIAKYFVPAATIAAFIPKEFSL
jgi:S1-C subfamily serine protease